MTSELALEFARKIRAREQAVGYWAVLDAPVATERIGRLGYDYVALDAQHGLLGYSGVLNGLMAIDAGHTAVGMVRVEDNNFTAIGKALDAGAVGVIVPLGQHRRGRRRRRGGRQVPADGRPLLRAHALGPADRARFRPTPTPPPWSSP